MFEFRIALRYLIPRKRSFSTALISILSTLVISLVIWLVLVFLSITGGMEKNWLQKLTSLHAPIRITPTDSYFHTYYYQIDTIAAASNYSLKTIGEKRVSPLTDPYSYDTDWEIPAHFQKKITDSKGNLLDPVKSLFQELETLKKEDSTITFQDYEISGALLRLSTHPSIEGGATSYISQMTYLLSITEENPHLPSLLCNHDQCFTNKKLTLPNYTNGDIPIFLPKSYQDSGASIGSRGTLSFSAPSAASSQEQRIWVQVAGFYDPGIVAIGNRCVLVPHEVTRSIAQSSQTFSPDGTPTNGIFIWANDLTKASHLKAEIEEKLRKKGIAPFWKVSTYEEYEFAKDLMHQFQSDKLLLLLIASIILVVACTNIISLLVLLVNDRKKEIAILQSMGASFSSISSIFAFCGVIMGTSACIIGSIAAKITLQNLDTLVYFLSKIQGRAVFNPAFFGHKLPNELSSDALFFVLLVTPILSLLAGLIPALKASKIDPTTTLRSE